MLAVLPIRHGAPPAGGDEAVAECAGRALLIGSGTRGALDELAGLVTEAHLVEVDGGFHPGAWSVGLATLLAQEPQIVLPASADGRDLAPRLAHLLGRPLFAHAAQVSTERVELIRGGDTHLHRVVPPTAFVATLQPGLRGAVRYCGVTAGVIEVDWPRDLAATPGDAPPDATVLAELEADAATVDLAEAHRIVAGGAGLDRPERFVELAELGRLVGAGVGATRVVTDRGWIDHERQIGTTGVVVDPELYVAFGISGAVQHTSGLGAPAHVVSVNTDAHCPMMQLSDLAVVADAGATLTALVAHLRATLARVDEAGANEAGADG